MPHVVAAGDLSSGFAGRLHGRREQRVEHADDRDDRQEFNEGEARAARLRPREHGGKFFRRGPDGG